jgi:HEAT repeat protein
LLLITGLLPACGLFGDSKPDEKPAQKKEQTQPTGSVWDQRIGSSGIETHSDRIGAASIDTLAMSGPSAAPKIADYITDPGKKVRDKAVKMLAKFGKKAESAVPKLLEFVRNVEPHIRASAAEALAKIGSKAAESGLERACKDSNGEVRVWAHAGLAKIEGDCPDHMEDVADLLNSGKLGYPGQAVEAMQMMNCPNEDVIKTLIEALNKGDEKTRAAAARAIGNSGPQAAAAVPALIGALGEKSFRIRQAALLALARMGPKAAPAVQLLIEILKDPAPRFRELAAHALGKIGLAARPAEAMLHKLTTDPEATVQAAAKRALASIKGGKP